MQKDSQYIGVAAIVLVVMVLCFTYTPESRGATVPTAPSPTGHITQVTEKDLNVSGYPMFFISVNNGLRDGIAITLPDSGGLTWTAYVMDNSVVGLNTMSHTNGSGIPGDYGSDNWLFTAMKTGSTAVQLNSKRGDQAGKSYIVNIQVYVVGGNTPTPPL